MIGVFNAGECVLVTRERPNICVVCDHHCFASATLFRIRYICVALIGRSSSINQRRTILKLALFQSLKSIVAESQTRKSGTLLQSLLEVVPLACQNQIGQKAVVLDPRRETPDISH